MTLQRWRRRLLRNERLRRAGAVLASRYIRLWRACGRWTVEGEERPAAYWRDGKPIIMVFWHGRLMLMPFCWPAGVPLKLLISNHRDGQMTAWYLERFGHGFLRGSSAKQDKREDKGAAGAVRQMVREARRGVSLGLTPDGPRGPRMRAQDGVITLARLTGLPILPVGAASSRRRIIDSWDRFIVPLPFGPCAYVWGAPIAVARDADAAAQARARREVEDSLLAVTRRADELVGQTAIEPAPMRGAEPV